MNNVGRIGARRASWATAVLGVGLALSGTAHANPFALKVGVDLSGVYQANATRFSVVCVLHQGNSTAGGSVHGEQLLRDLVNGQYVGRWKDTLTLMFTDRTGVKVSQPGGYFNCSLTLDDGASANTVLGTIGGKFPIAYNYLGQFTYRGRPPRMPTTPNNGFSGLGSSKLHIFKP